MMLVVLLCFVFEFISLFSVYQLVVQSLHLLIVFDYTKSQTLQTSRTVHVMRLACLVHIPFPKWVAVILAPVRALSDTQRCWETKSKYIFGLQLALAASLLLLMKRDIVMLQSHGGVSPAWALALNTSHGLFPLHKYFHHYKIFAANQECKNKNVKGCSISKHHIQCYDI